MSDAQKAPAPSAETERAVEVAAGKPSMTRAEALAFASRRSTVYEGRIYDRDRDALIPRWWPKIGGQFISVGGADGYASRDEALAATEEFRQIVRDFALAGEG